MLRSRSILVAATLLTGLVCLGGQNLPSLPVQHYDYHIPANAISPISLGMGGINLTNPADYFSPYDNPALLAQNTNTAFAVSYRLRNADNLSFAELVSASNVLKSKQFMYYNLVTKNAAWSYQPVASVNVSQYLNGSGIYEYYDYQLDKLQLSIAGTDDKYTSLSGGLNLKYLTGRLVYMRRTNPGNVLKEFIDNKVKGVSGDLGFYYTGKQYNIGICAYDLLSYLKWEDYNHKILQRRIAGGIQYNANNLALSATAQGKISSTPETTYHFGLVKNWPWESSGKKQQNLILRVGLFSKDFNGTDNINYTLGSGYNYSLLRFDFAMTNTGMQLKDSQYLFSVGVGIQ